MVELGDRIELVHTDNPHTALEPGDEGVVTEISFVPVIEDVRIKVKWDKGVDEVLIKDLDDYSVKSTD